MSKTSKNDKKDDKYQLPMKEIKSDLLKTGIFVVFALVFLLLLHFGNVTTESIVSTIKSVAGRQ